MKCLLNSNSLKINSRSEKFVKYMAIHENTLNGKDEVTLGPN